MIGSYFGGRPALVVGLSLVFTRTNLGLSMRATAFNPEVARLSGVRVSRTLTIGWAIAGIVGAVAGVLVAPISTLSPNSASDVARPVGVMCVNRMR